MKRLMIIDDSSVIRKVAKHVLSKPDLVVVEAASGKEALALCAEQMPDTILCDVSLVDMEVVHFIAEVKKIKGASQPQIVVNHHEVNLPVIMRAKRAGATGFILKPFNRPTLLKRFRELNMAA